MSNIIKYNMASGIPGVISRTGGGVVMDVEPCALSAASPIALYGLAGIYNAADGAFRALAVGDAVISGFLSRPFPQNATSATGFFGSTVLGAAGVPPQAGGEGANMRAGYMTVLLQGNNAGVVTAAAKGGQVYVCIQNPPAGGSVGGVTAAADGGNTIAINATFSGPADDSGNVEISLNVSKVSAG